MAVDPFGIDKSIVERGYWIAVHRLAIEKWITIGLYIVVAFGYILFFVQFGAYLYRYGEWDVLIAGSKSSLIAWDSVKAANAPQDLEFADPQVFATGDNRYDFVVEAYNPNTQWALSDFAYQFDPGTGQAVITGKSFILPGERKLLTVLAYQSTTPIPSVAGFNASGFRWQKVARPPALSWTFTAAPLYTGKQIIVDQNKQTVIPAHVTWSVQNASTLSIRTVVWQVLLYNGRNLASVIEYRAEKFGFLENRDFDLLIPELPGQITSVKVYPIVNIFDPNYTYLK